jgi:hypothetical protein
MAITTFSSLQDWHALLLDKEPWFGSSTGSSLLLLLMVLAHDVDYVDSEN